jgi:hypothetical protein
MSVRFWSKGSRGPRRPKKMIELKSVTLGVFEVIYAALNMTKPKGEEFIENASFRKLVKDQLGTSKSGNGPDMASIPEGGCTLVLEDSTFRYVEKTFKWAQDSGEVFIGSGSELVAEAIEVFKTAKKPAKIDNGNNGSEVEEAKRRLPAGV